MAHEAREFAEHIGTELGRVIVGQRDTIEQVVTVLLCGGHALLEGVPGIAKTLIVKALARVCRLSFQRVQCAPDLMPADITGGSVYTMATGAFTVHRGPVFTDLLLIDEINRMPPRTQAALLECMEERQVTIDGASYPLSPWFAVFATQNPVEFEGTYPLPEAQLDRFHLKIRVDYPSADEESEILDRHQNGFDARELERMDLQPIPAGVAAAARAEAGAVRVEPELLRYIAQIVRRTRDWPALSLGGSPRASVCLLQSSKVRAALDGRDYVIPDDVKAMAAPVLRHRIIVRPESDLEGLTPDRVVAEVVAQIEIPKLKEAET